MVWFNRICGMPPSPDRYTSDLGTLSGQPGTRVSGDGALRALGVALEEQRLADHGPYRRGLERLGDQERRLGPLAGQETLRIGGNEDDRRFERAQQLVHRIEPRA